MIRYNNGELYRIMAGGYTLTETGDFKYTCEHVWAILIDDILEDDHIIGNIGIFTRTVLQYILDHQEQQNWVLGDVEFIHQFEYLFQNETLLSALVQVVKRFTLPFIWEFDTHQYPYVLHLRRLREENKPDMYVWPRKNALKLVKKSDATTLCTQIHPRGEGEGINQLNIRSVNNGRTYLRSPPEYIQRYGLVKRVWIDRRYTDAQSLKEAAQAMLDELQEPYEQYEADFASLGTTEYDIPATGKKVDLRDIDGKSLKQTWIVGIRWNHDEIKKSKLAIANRPRDIAGTVAEMMDRQRIEMAYAQGATNIFQDNVQDNADPGAPVQLKFRIPVDMRVVNSVLIDVEMGDFRRPFTITALGGSPWTRASSTSLTGNAGEGETGLAGAGRTGLTTPARTGETGGATQSATPNDTGLAGAGETGTTTPGRTGETGGFTQATTPLATGGAGAGETGLTTPGRTGDTGGTTQSTTPGSTGAALGDTAFTTPIATGSASGNTAATTPGATGAATGSTASTTPGPTGNAGAGDTGTAGGGNTGTSGAGNTGSAGAGNTGNSVGNTSNSTAFNTGNSAGNTGAASGNTENSAAFNTSNPTGSGNNTGNNTAFNTANSAAFNSGAPSNANTGGMAGTSTPATGGVAGSGAAVRTSGMVQTNSNAWPQTLTSQGPSNNNTNPSGAGGTRAANPAVTGSVPGTLSHNHPMGHNHQIDPHSHQMNSHTHHYTIGQLNHNHTFPHTHGMGAHTHTPGTHTHQVGAHLHSVGAHSHPLGSHTHQVGAHGHGIGGHTHPIPNHAHSVGAHNHGLNNHNHSMANHTHSVSAHAHSVDAHHHTLNNHVHTSSAHAHGLNDHTHTSAGHVHGLNAHTHTSAAHSHGLNNHRHTSAEHTHLLNLHSHTSAAHLHALSNHQHTSAAHNHQLDMHSHTSAGHLHSISNHRHASAAHAHTLNMHSHTSASHDHSTANHRHSMSNHRHNMEHVHGIEDHSHELTPGITWVGNPQSFRLRINGQWRGPVFMTRREEIDITGFLVNAQNMIPRGVWHRVEIWPDDVANIMITLQVQGFMQSRGNLTV